MAESGDSQAMEATTFSRAARMMGDRVETVLRHYHRCLPDKERRDGARFLERLGVGGSRLEIENSGRERESLDRGF